MLSVVIPVYNEEKAITKVIDEIRGVLEGEVEFEIIAVNDGSSDGSLSVLKGLKHRELRVVNHIDNLGYGKSLFDGIIKSKYNCIAIIDCDGSYPAESIKELYEYYQDYDMVVGARTGKIYHSNIIKRISRIIFNFLAEYASGRKIEDINSGLRIFRKDVVLNFKENLCTGFSFTTTITLLFMLNHYYVKYIPITYNKRDGKSKVKHFKDSLRAAQIIVQAILFYNPIKLFLLLGITSFCLGLFCISINFFFIKSIYLSVLASIFTASIIPIFCAGLIADILRTIHKNQN